MSAAAPPLNRSIPPRCESEGVKPMSIGKSVDDEPGPEPSLPGDEPSVSPARCTPITRCSYCLSSISPVSSCFSRFPSCWAPWVPDARLLVSVRWSLEIFSVTFVSVNALSLPAFGFNGCFVNRNFSSSLDPPPEDAPDFRSLVGDVGDSKSCDCRHDDDIDGEDDVM